MICVLLLSATGVTAQHKASWCECSKERAAETRVRHRYVLWPNSVCSRTVIDGLGVGVYAGPVQMGGRLRINGINIEADPAPVFIVPYLSFTALLMFPDVISSYKEQALKATYDPRSDYFYQRDSIVQTTVSGLNISTGVVLGQTKINGAAVNALIGMEREMNGVEVTGLVNFHRSFSGVIAAPINLCRKGRGVQIGLYNYCREGNVVQIGLINRYGKRALPFVNIGRKKKR